MKINKGINWFLILLIILIIIMKEFKEFLGDNYILIMILTSLAILLLMLEKGKLSFFVYLVMLMIVLLFRRPVDFESNMSFDTFRKWVPIIMSNRTVFVNVIGNIVLYIPMGLFFGRRVSFFDAMAFGYTFIVGFELIQLLLNLGMFDVVDIFLNTIGLMGGYLIISVWRWYVCVIKTKKRSTAS